MAKRFLFVILTLIGVISFAGSGSSLSMHNTYTPIFSDTVKSTGDSVVTILLDTLRNNGQYSYLTNDRSMVTYKNSHIWFFCDSVNADSLDLRITMSLGWKDDTTYWMSAILDSTIDTHKVIYVYPVPTAWALAFNNANYLRFSIKGNAGNDKAKGSKITLKVRFAEDGY